MRKILAQLNSRHVFTSLLVGIVLAITPFLFWRIFLQQLPLTGTGSATLSDRFEETGDTPVPTQVSERQSRLRELLPHPANSLSVDRTSGVMRMYEKGTGRAFEVSPTTLQVTILSEAHLESFDHTLWSPNGTQVITLFHETDGSEYRYYDYGSGKVAALPKNVRALAFSRTGDRIVTSRETQNGTELWISKPDGTDPWRLLVTRLHVMHVYWPHDDMVVVHTLRQNDQEDLVAFDMKGNVTRLLESYSSLEVRWAPSGVHALVSYMDDEHELILALLDVQKHSITTLPLTSRASKCAWHNGSSQVTCGSPAQTTSASKDTISSLDLGTGELTLRYTPGDDIWIALSEPAMLPRGNGIAFINVFDARPYLVSW